MPESHKHEYTSAQKPNWVDIGTFIVLSVTLLAVIFYACEAHRQNELTKNIIRMNSRASIGGVWDSHKVVPQVNQKFNIPLGLINFGQSTVADVTTIAVYTLDKIPEPSLASAETIRKFVWPRPIGNLFDTYSDDAVTDAQLNDMRAGRGWLLVKTVIVYGPYTTKMCTSLPLQPSQNGPLKFGRAELCSAPKSNCVDEECNQ